MGGEKHPDKPANQRRGPSALKDLGVDPDEESVRQAIARELEIAGLDLPTAKVREAAAARRFDRSSGERPSRRTAAARRRY